MYAAKAPLAAIVSLFGAVVVLTAPIHAMAQSGAAHHHHHHAAAQTAEEAKETVEDRIKTLHAKLAITADEETKWATVAQVMRDNEADMQRLKAERHATPAHELTAVEDLQTYEHFTQEHVKGLKTLIAAFQALYASMPTSQQAVADGVFRHFGAHEHARRS